MEKIDRVDEMYACMVKQGYVEIYTGMIGINLLNWMMVEDILKEEGY